MKNEKNREVAYKNRNKKRIVYGLLMLVVILFIVGLIVFVSPTKTNNTGKEETLESTTDTRGQIQDSSESDIKSENSSVSDETTKETSGLKEEYVFERIPSVANLESGIPDSSEYTEIAYEVREPYAEATREELKKDDSQRDYSKMYLSYGELEYVLKHLDLGESNMKVVYFKEKDKQLIVGVYFYYDDDDTDDVMQEFLDGELKRLIGCSAYAVEPWITNENAIRLVKIEEKE